MENVAPRVPKPGYNLLHFQHKTTVVKNIYIAVCDLKKEDSDILRMQTLFCSCQDFRSNDSEILNADSKNEKIRRLIPVFLSKTTARVFFKQREPWLMQ